ncbi:carbohydrate binding domain-containing protein [Flavobacterium sp.]|uniref:carbohydrate binding domain-containing protein n=1 Tax=Flavobacterium sp. TaxID=239 RepID=UPI002C9494D7|nr:carbohydrate binding domain-containing protein [Flavobacterium sp.]HSD06288.1 carbohydrate binding domain-containing protein [Flavobacterium sp.]
MKKNYLSLLLVLSGAILSLNAQNLLSNSGFENGTGDEFTNWTKTNGQANLTAETVNIHSGTRSLKAVSTGTYEYNVQLQSDDIATIVGVNYEISIWIKGVAGGNTVRFSTVGGTAVYAPDYTVAKDVWQKYIYGFTATATTTKISLDLGKGTDTFYIDDAEMFNLSTVPTKDFILNGDLEAGTGDTFTNWNKYNGGANLTAETVEVHSGSRALKAVSTGANEFNVQLVSDEMTLEVGRTYTASMWIKAVNGGNTVRFSTTAASANYGPNTIITNTNWQKISYSFQAKSAITRLNLDLGKSTDTFYIDDISFVGANPTLANSKFETSSDKIIFYPNPVINSLSIAPNSGIKSFKIIDISGKTVIVNNKAENIQSVDLSSLRKGVYILTTDSNQNFKFIKN